MQKRKKGRKGLAHLRTRGYCSSLKYLLGEKSIEVNKKRREIHNFYFNKWLKQHGVEL